MRTFLVIVFIGVGLGLVDVYGQFYPSSVYESATGRQRSAGEVDAMKRIYDAERSQAGMDQLAAMSNSIRNGGSVFISEYPSYLATKAKKHVLPNPEFSTRYASFLRLPKTGLVRLLPAKACLQDKSDPTPKFEKVIARCPFAFIQGGARYFSFRTRDYVKPDWADIGFSGKWIFSFGIFNQGILVNLGDIALENVSLTSKGVDFLTSLTPAVEIEKADEEYKQFEEGVKRDDLIYQHLLPLETDRTYCLRVIAYRADYSRQISTGRGNVKIYPLRGDARDDIVVAFRIVHEDSENGLTLLWRELQRKEGPKMILPAQQKATEPK